MILLRFKLLIIFSVLAGIYYILKYYIRKYYDQKLKDINKGDFK